MSRQSAGILLYRYSENKPEFLLVHPGGPLYKKKDEGVWSIPKGEFDQNENAMDAAVREFQEETGYSVAGNFIPLTPVKLKSGKLVHAFGLEGNIDETKIKSELFEMEWPPRSGKKAKFPEVDKAEWFVKEIAEIKINAGQVPLIRELNRILTEN